MNPMSRMAASASARGRAEGVLSSTQRLPSRLPLDRIKLQDHRLRGIKRDHVDRLVESIKAEGLLQPLVVDRGGRLIAGGHRLEAIKRLQEVAPDVFGRHFGSGVNVVSLPIDSDSDQIAALRAEIAENEMRLDFSRAEVAKIVEVLREAGFDDTRGRPKKGTLPMAPALQDLFGVKRRTVVRMLAALKAGNAPAGAIPDVARKEVAKRLKGLKRAVVQLLACDGLAQVKGAHPAIATIVNGLPVVLESFALVEFAAIERG